MISLLPYLGRQAAEKSKRERMEPLASLFLYVEHCRLLETKDDNIGQQVCVYRCLGMGMGGSSGLKIFFPISVQTSHFAFPSSRPTSYAKGFATLLRQAFFAGHHFFTGADLSFSNFCRTLILLYILLQNFLEKIIFIEIYYIFTNHYFCFIKIV